MTETLFNHENIATFAPHWIDQPETPLGQIEFDLTGPSVDKRCLAVMQEMAARSERFDRVASRIETIAEDIKHLKQELRYRHRDPRGATKRQHVADIRLMGGKCPCCGSTDVLDADGQRSSEADFDHYYASSHPDAEHTWLICRPCHLGLTTGRVPWDQTEAEFWAYQSKRRRLGDKSGCFDGRHAKRQATVQSGSRFMLRRHNCLWSN